MLAARLGSSSAAAFTCGDAETREILTEILASLISVHHVVVGSPSWSFSGSFSATALTRDTRMAAANGSIRHGNQIRPQLNTEQRLNLRVNLQDSSCIAEDNSLSTSRMPPALMLQILINAARQQPQSVSELGNIALLQLRPNSFA